MNTHRTSTSSNTTQSRLCQSVVSRIEAENMTPRSRWVFFGRECMLWLLWALSVLFGVLAVSVSLYVFIHTHYALYEATHENFLTFMVEFLPLAWLMVIALMTIFAYYNLRHTRGGYRYSMSRIFASSLLFSIAGGAALHVAGMGYMLDHEIEKWVPSYHSMDSRERALWQQPADGRLLGYFVRDEVGSSSAITFTDVDGDTWRLVTVDLRESDMRLLTSEQLVRVIGIAETEQRFHSCGVFPWLHTEAATIRDMARERAAFVERMYAHRGDSKKTDVTQTLPLVERDVLHTTTSEAAAINKTPCKELAVLKRLKIAE